ncbi:AzlD domain-containing protein [Pasteurellaceae bacterium HPA106]|uniref:AzlD domain-containing protein n=1 Tax=Spirabiliibacterium pneumoniae TaxID=221400 RepID=UPI001AAE163A|nr:AzlD domain-containing protein [Spirabiliibacterium pneumoniae]MBE2896397.1 AzlD domain-containing protein [Spirabiliibacterium pneumoniae]
MNTLDTLITLLGMAGAMVICRGFPLLMPASWLQMRWLQALNQMLPLCIMLILLLSSLSLPTLSGDWLPFARELAALCVVLISYRTWHNTLLSVVIGIVSINVIYLLV